MTCELIFSHPYVWLNRGEWRSGSHEGDAIDAAKTAALRAEKWVYESEVIVVRRLPCDAGHIDVCWHGVVEFYR